MATERPVLTGNQGGGGLGSRLTTRGLPARARLALRLAGGGLLIATGAIHLDLYLTGYRSIPAIGWLFLLQVIAAFGLAAVVLASGEWLGRGRFLPGGHLGRATGPCRARADAASTIAPVIEVRPRRRQALTR